MRPGVRAAVLGLALGSAAVAGACASATGPGVPLSIQFDSLPYPSVVYGDTLRDSTGAVAVLRAKVFDGVGAQLTTIATTFVPLDSGLRVDSAGRAVATGWRDAGVRVLASVSGLQSKVATLLITRRPDTLIATSTNDSIAYDFPTSLSQNTSGGPSLQLRSHQVVPNATGDTVSKGWVVTYQLLYRPDTTVADSVLVVGDDGLPSLVDTTDANGTAVRRIRIVPHAGAQVADSVVLQAAASYRGQPVPGSPLRLVVRLSRAVITP